ncbi:pyridoxine 5'-phosphate synthase [soil metagenome]
MKLTVNIDHIATLREARGGLEPDPVLGAGICELAGASGIVCHLREDRRHINDRDVRLLREMVKTKLDLEMAATDEMVKIALEILPELVTLVPEKREELTTEGGLDIFKYSEKLSEVIDRLHVKDIEVSLFIEPEIESVEKADELGADIIELHTGKYANLIIRDEIEDEFEKLRNAAVHAYKLGMIPTAGHGLNYTNIKPFLQIKEIEEVSIGHSLISRAVFTGLERAVKDMLEIMNSK